MIQRMLPWASDDLAEEQLEKLNIDWDCQPLTIQSAEKKGVLAGSTLYDVWTCP
jgi:hypothetical protein